MILILGNPGAGKTTQASLLSEYLDCPCFSMGDLIRKKVTGQDRRDMLAGKIISDDVTLRAADEALKKIDDKVECVFEGNPRSITQAKWWLQQQAAGRFMITGVIHMTADPTVAEERLIKRGRLDDHNDDVIEKRFAEYRRSITPTLDYLRKNGVNVYEIDANQSIDAVAKHIRQALGIDK